ncbi:dehydrogenase, partial [Cryobacterium sp. MLB-32]|uniref:Gfo/Idh/MocA family oxidoreductase n=1 Tax=Cryobacterium sp. MLB-32 TaxID=1529318 RepID=UPI0004E6A173
MKNVTLGLIGVGRIGVMHARNIATLSNADESVRTITLKLTDIAAEHAQAVAADLGASYHPDLETLIASGIDGLIIATGTAL